jgi:hypothetical protein
MHVLLVIHSDDTDTVKSVSSQLLDDNEVPEILSYMPLVVSSADASKDSSAADFAREQNSQLPVSKGIFLAAVDANGRVLGAFTLQGDKSGGDAAAARAFVARHQPPPHDAAESFATALAQAAASNRNVLIQGSGPRCIPCVGLTRWIETHRGLLARDYVLLKIDVDRDRNGKALAQRLVPRIDSIPWMAIVDAKGKLLADSEGPLGNVGFPSQFEDLRHFRDMLAATRRSLTAEEIAMLIESLDSP